MIYFIIDNNMNVQNKENRKINIHYNGVSVVDKYILLRI